MDNSYPEGFIPEGAQEYTGYPEGWNPDRGQGMSMMGFAEDAADWIVENPTASGGMIGGSLGMLAGPVGSVVGGAAGSALGSLIESSQQKDTMSAEDYKKAAEEALFSLGIDVATIGVGALVKGGYFMAKQAMGMTPKEVADEIAEVGSQESFRRTQKMLQSRGATLTPSQFGDSTLLQRLRENIGRVGIFAGRRFDDNAAKVNEAVNKEFDHLFGVHQAQSVDELGQAFNAIIQEGRKGLNNLYDFELQQTKNLIRGKQVDPSYLADGLDTYLRGRSFPKKVEVIDPKTGEVNIVTRQQSTLDPKTIAVIQEQIDMLRNVKEMPAINLLDIQRMLNTKIDEVGSFGTEAYSKNASRELAEFSTFFRDAMSSQLAKVSPEAAGRMKAANKAFSEISDQLMPKMNNTFVSKANNDVYEGLGKILVNNTNASQSRALIQQLKQAYKLMDKEQLAKAPFKSADEAINVVRASYVKNTMPKLGGDDFSIDAYKNLAQRFKNPSERKRAAAVLGDKFVPFMDLLNTMSQAAVKPKGNLPTLIMRSKEYAAAGAVGGLAASVATGTGLAATGTVLTGAAALFGLAEIFARIATDPAAVTRLKKFNQSKFENTADMITAFNVIANDLVKDDVAAKYGEMGGTF